jgi:PAS domain S-box-containing protein
VELDYSALLDHARDVIAVFDRDQRYVYINAAIAALWGGQPSDYIGSVVGGRNLEEDTHAWRDAIIDVAKSGNRRSLEMTFQTTRGPRRFASVFTPFANDLVCAVTRDVTDIYAARLLDTAARTMASGLAIIDAESGHLVFANDEFRRPLALGRQPRLADYHGIAVFTEDGRQLAPREWPAARALAGETVLGTMVRIERGDGQHVWLAASAAPVRDDDARVVAAVSTHVDITAQKRAHQQARLLADVGELLERFEPTTTLQAVVDLVVPFLGDWCYIHLASDDVDRPRLVVAAGIDAVQVASAHVRSHEPKLLSRDTPLVRVLAGGAAELVELDAESLARGATDEARVAELGERSSRAAIVAPLVGRSGVLGAMTVAMAGSARHYDRTDLELVVELARRTGIALENARLYSELREHEDQLEKAIERAYLADRRKDEFLAMLGHELRNPLAPITTALELMSLKSGGMFEKERGVIRRQVDHLSRLIDDLLDMSRITSGKIQLAREVVEVGGVVAQAIEMASPLLEKRGRRLSIDVPAEGLLVDADPMRLAQVFQNLLTNAAKYSEPTSPIEISARREGAQAVVEVRDHGIGISPELLPRVFELFVQGERTIERAEGGLGIGLAIAKSLCELHGGTIDARSDGARRGSAFTVRLPLSTGAAAGAAIASTSVPRPVGTGKRVLVVDDNVDAAEMLCHLLDTVGFELMTAHDGARALEIAREFKPDIALLDIGLPVMNGYELARALRAQHPVGALRLIAITGYGQDDDRARARDAGFDHHIVKPIAFDGLLRLLEQ